MLNYLDIQGVICSEATLTRVNQGLVLGNAKFVFNRFYRKEGSLIKESSYFDLEGKDDIAYEMEEICKPGVTVQIIGSIRQDYWKTDKNEERSKTVIEVTLIKEIKEKRK